MEAGLTIYNDANTIQIDSTYRNLTYVRTRNISSGEQIIPPPSNAPRMTALHSPSGVICAPTFVRVGNQFISKDGFYVVGNGELWDFEDAEIIPTHHGLNVYRGDGSICYSSETKPLRILYHQSGVLSSYADQILYSGTLAAGRKLAVILGQQPVCNYGEKVNGLQTLTGKALKVTTSADGFVKVEFTRFYGFTANVTGAVGNLHYDFVIVDITGF